MPPDLRSTQKQSLPATRRACRNAASSRALLRLSTRLPLHVAGAGARRAAVAHLPARRYGLLVRDATGLKVVGSRSHAVHLQLSRIYSGRLGACVRPSTERGFAWRSARSQDGVGAHVVFVIRPPGEVRARRLPHRLWFWIFACVLRQKAVRVDPFLGALPRRVISSRVLPGVGEEHRAHALSRRFPFQPHCRVRA